MESHSANVGCNMMFFRGHNKCHHYLVPFFTIYTYGVETIMYNLYIAFGIVNFNTNGAYFYGKKSDIYFASQIVEVILLQP